MSNFYYDRLHELSERENRDNILLSWAGADATGGVVEDGWRIEHWQRFTIQELHRLLDHYRVEYDYAGVAGHFCLVISTDRNLELHDSETERARQRSWADDMRTRWGAGTMLWSLGQDTYGRVIVVFSVVDTYRLFDYQPKAVIP